MDEVETIGVYDAVSIGVTVSAVNEDAEGELSLTLMQRRGSSDDPYGGYVEVTSEARPHLPYHIDRDNLEVEMTEELPTQETFDDVKTRWNAEDGGPYEVRKKNDGIEVREWDGQR